MHSSLLLWYETELRATVNDRHPSFLKLCELQATTESHFVFSYCEIRICFCDYREGTTEIIPGLFVTKKLAEGKK